MDLGLKDKVAFIAASSQGLGKAVAFELVQEGAKVIINGRNGGTLERTKQEIKLLAGQEVLSIAGDLSISGEREKIINTALQTYGTIDILVTNTGGRDPERSNHLAKMIGILLIKVCCQVPWA